MSSFASVRPSLSLSVVELPVASAARRLALSEAEVRWCGYWKLDAGCSKLETEDSSFQFLALSQSKGQLRVSSFQ
jgi:hypothetical protein